MQGQSQKIIAGAMARASWRKPLRAEKVTMAMYNERCSGNFQKCGDIILDKLESRQTTLLVEIPPELKSRWSRETEHIYAIVRNGEVMKLGGTRTGMKKRWDSSRTLCSTTHPEAFWGTFPREDVSDKCSSLPHN